MFNKSYRKFIKDFLKESKASLAIVIKKYSKKNITEDEANNFSVLILTMLDEIGLHILMEEDNDEYLKTWNLQMEFICISLNNS